MKKLIFIAAMMCATHSHAATKDEACLSVGSYAKSVAEARELGMAEDEVISSAGKNSPYSAAFKSVVQLVYTLQMEPATARQMVYTKCMVDGFALSLNTAKGRKS